MSEYDKGQSYGVYDYQSTTRPEQVLDYTAFAQPAYTSEYAGTQSQVPSGLPQTAAPTFTPITASQQYGSHDPHYYHPPQHVPYSGFVEPAPRPLPEVISYTPNQGQQGTKVTVYLRSIYDLDVPEVTPVIAFAQKRCQSVLIRTAQQSSSFEYALSAEAPPPNAASMQSPHVSLSLHFDNGAVTWQSPSLEFGNFAYLDSSAYYPTQSSHLTQKKRKMSAEASPRRSPGKKPSLQQLSGATGSATLPSPGSPFRRPSIAYGLPQSRRFSGPEHQQDFTQALPRGQSQQLYGVGYGVPSFQSSQAPSWSYNQPSATQSPSAVAMSATTKSSLLPSPGGSHNPPLIRTSTIHQSPTAPPTVTPTISTSSTFNPYAYFPSSKAILKIDGDLNTMADSWTSAERDTKRRLVQFRRNQQGSVITGNFEPVTLEERIPNSICVSCIWWEEKDECYVTSVDTISLLESLVAVRFTVEEKNRIRRNLEGFRPATVSKGKADSEEFFKLIMGFPNPKPRNIEKDVKVFPWRILAGALKKIIGKYSASYSSTAGALHTSTSAPELQQRPGASPISTSSSATSHGHAYAPHITGSYSSVGLGIAQSPGGPDPRLTVPMTSMQAPPSTQTTSWHQPSPHYSSDLSATGRASWDFPGTYQHAPPSSSLPNVSYPYSHRISSLTGPAPIHSEPARFVPLHAYDDQSQQTTSG